MSLDSYMQYWSTYFNSFYMENNDRAFVTFYEMEEKQNDVTVNLIQI